MSQAHLVAHDQTIPLFNRQVRLLVDQRQPVGDFVDTRVHRGFKLKTPRVGVEAQGDKDRPHDAVEGKGAGDARESTLKNEKEEVSTKLKGSEAG